MGAHFISTIFVGIAYHEGIENSWIEKYNLPGNWFDHYMYALYWAITTMTSVGYGDITPATKQEITYVVIVMFTACFTFGYCISVINIIFENSTKRNKQYNQDMRILSRYLDQNKIEKDLCIEVRKYLEYTYQEDYHLTIQDQNYIMGKLPIKLQKKLITYTNITYLLNLTIFKKNFSEAFLKKLSSKMVLQGLNNENKILDNKGQEVDPTFYIFNENQNNNKFQQNNLNLQEEENQNLDIKKQQKINLEDLYLYFVVSGKLQLGINIGEQFKVLKNLEKYDFFNQIPFITENNQYSYQIKSTGNTKLLKIDKANFIRTLKDFPEDYEKYLMVKDSINFKISNSYNQVQCLNCKEFGHLFENCTRVTMQYDIEKLVLRNNYTEIHEYRISDIQRELLKTENCWTILNEIQECQEFFTNDINQEETINNYYNLYLYNHIKIQNLEMYIQRQMMDIDKKQQQQNYNNNNQQNTNINHLNRHTSQNYRFQNMNDQLQQSQQRQLFTFNKKQTTEDNIRISQIIQENLESNIYHKNNSNNLNNSQQQLQLIQQKSIVQPQKLRRLNSRNTLILTNNYSKSKFFQNMNSNHNSNNTLTSLNNNKVSKSKLNFAQTNNNNNNQKDQTDISSVDSYSQSNLPDNCDSKSQQLLKVNTLKNQYQKRSSDTPSFPPDEENSKQNSKNTINQIQINVMSNNDDSLSDMNRTMYRSMKKTKMFNKFSTKIMKSAQNFNQPMSKDNLSLKRADSIEIDQNLSMPIQPAESLSNISRSMLYQKALKKILQQSENQADLFQTDFPISNIDKIFYKGYQSFFPKNNQQIVIKQLKHANLTQETRPSNYHLYFRQYYFKEGNQNPQIKKKEKKYSIKNHDDELKAQEVKRQQQKEFYKEQRIKRKSQRDIQKFFHLNNALMKIQQIQQKEKDHQKNLSFQSQFLNNNLNQNHNQNSGGKNLQTILSANINTNNINSTPKNYNKQQQQSYSPHFTPKLNQNYQQQQQIQQQQVQSKSNFKHVNFSESVQMQIKQVNNTNQTQNDEIDIPNEISSQIISNQIQKQEFKTNKYTENIGYQIKIEYQNE